MSDSAIQLAAAQQASVSMLFSRQEYWSGYPFLSPGELPDSGIKPKSPALQSEPPRKPHEKEVSNSM